MAPCLPAGEERDELKPKVTDGTEAAKGIAAERPRVGSAGRRQHQQHRGSCPQPRGRDEQPGGSGVVFCNRTKRWREPRRACWRQLSLQLFLRLFGSPWLHPACRRCLRSSLLPSSCCLTEQSHNPLASRETAVIQLNSLFMLNESSWLSTACSLHACLFSWQKMLVHIRSHHGTINISRFTGTYPAR